MPDHPYRALINDLLAQQVELRSVIRAHREFLAELVSEKEGIDIDEAEQRIIALERKAHAQLLEAIERSNPAAAADLDCRTLKEIEESEDDEA